MWQQRSHVHRSWLCESHQLTCWQINITLTVPSPVLLPIVKESRNSHQADWTLSHLAKHRYYFHCFRDTVIWQKILCFLNQSYCITPCRKTHDETSVDDTDDNNVLVHWQALISVICICVISCPMQKPENGVEDIQTVTWLCLTDTDPVYIIICAYLFNLFIYIRPLLAIVQSANLFTTLHSFHGSETFQKDLWK